MNDHREVELAIIAALVSDARSRIDDALQRVVRLNGRYAGLNGRIPYMGLTLAESSLMAVAHDLELQRGQVQP